MTPSSFRPQFSLFGLMALTALFAVVFGLLAAMGTSPVQVAVGFLVFGSLVAALIAIIEAFAQLIGARR